MPPDSPYPTWDPPTALVTPTPQRAKPAVRRLQARQYYYFSYGSNLWLEQMSSRCPNATRVGQGRLKGWRWVISERGYANIIPSTPSFFSTTTMTTNRGGGDDGGGSVDVGGSVSGDNDTDHGERGDGGKDQDYTYGVIYTLTQPDMDNLDEYEGVDILPVPAYVKVTLPIELVEGKAESAQATVLDCLVYVDPRTKTGQPRKEYIDRINMGLRDAQLSDEWVRKTVRLWIPEEDPEESFARKKLRPRVQRRGRRVKHGY